MPPPPQPPHSPFPRPLSPISLNHPYPSLSSPHLLFHFRDSLSFGKHSSMIVASARGGEPNAIITRRAIINSVSNGNGERRAVDCCGVLRDHVRGLCLFSGTPHSPVKLFCRRSHCRLLSTEGCRKGNTILFKGYGVHIAYWKASNYIVIATVSISKMWTDTVVCFSLVMHLVQSLWWAIMCNILPYHSLM